MNGQTRHQEYYWVLSTSNVTISIFCFLCCYLMILCGDMWEFRSFSQTEEHALMCSVLGMLFKLRMFINSSQHGQFHYIHLPTSTILSYVDRCQR